MADRPRAGQGSDQVEGLNLRSANGLSMFELFVHFVFVVIDSLGKFWNRSSVFSFCSIYSEGESLCSERKSQPVFFWNLLVLDSFLHAVAP